MSESNPDRANKRRAFPIRIYLEKPDYYDVNKDAWWAITDKTIKWVQWILFIAMLDVVYSRTNRVSIRVVEYVLIFLVFRATLSMCQIAIRVDVNGVREKGAIYYLLSALLTLLVIALLYHFGWQFADDVFSAFIDAKKAN